MHHEERTATEAASASAKTTDDAVQHENDLILSCKSSAAPQSPNLCKLERRVPLDTFWLQPRAYHDGTVSGLAPGTLTPYII